MQLLEELKDGETSVGDAAWVTPRDHHVPHGSPVWGWSPPPGQQPSGERRPLPTHSIFPQGKSGFILTTAMNRSGSQQSDPGPRISGGPDTAARGDCSDPVYSLVSSSKSGMSMLAQLYPSLLIILSGGI